MEKSVEKILIVEGDGALGERLAEALKQKNYNVFLVKNGNEAMKAMEDILPHLVLLNVSLPGIEGYDILEKKQAEPLLSSIPVFLLSTQGIPINMTKIPAGSIKEYLVSYTVDPAEIVQKVNRHFGKNSPENTNSASSSVGKKKKVLWVEDDKLISSILEKKFISSGFDLMHAKNGEEAIEMVKNHIPDIIVLDLLLPGMSGFEILQKLKTDERLKDVPAMILSNLSKPSDIEKAKILGAQRFLVKAATSLDQIVEEVQVMFK